VALLVFKTSVGLNKVSGGFDSHPPPPASICDLRFAIYEPARPPPFGRSAPEAQVPGNRLDHPSSGPCSIGCSMLDVRCWMLSPSLHPSITPPLHSPPASVIRLPQPPVNPALRDLEHHDFWPGFIAALIGVILLFCGARHLTSVDTVEGNTAWETQLVKAFSAGGLQYPVPPAPPPKSDDSAAGAEALDRWTRLQASLPAPTWKVRVDTGARNPCPT
jgi:hypothetical protein